MEENSAALTHYFPLYKAALQGDWESAEEFFQNDGDALTARISQSKETALHVAVAGGHSQFAEKLVELMPAKALAFQDVSQCNALHYAAMGGFTSIAKALVQKNRELTQMLDYGSHTPLFCAAYDAAEGKEEILWYLCEVTRDEDPSPFAGQSGADILAYIIEAGYYVVPVHPPNQPNHPMRKDGMEDPPMSSEELARVLTWSHSRIRTIQVLQWLNRLPWKAIEQLVPSVKQVRDTKLAHLYSLELVRFICRQIMRMNYSEVRRIFSTNNMVKTAAQCGNVELLMICAEYIPNLFWMNWGHKMFHIAVEHRQEKIFNLLHELNVRKKLMVNGVYDDDDDNTILHFAAQLAPPPRLNSVSGAALQMQRELQWYKEVEKIVQPMHKDRPNHNGTRPRILFTEQHKDLVEKGEKWMKDTASSCMVVATLIATVVFTAAFIVPGGNDSDKGIPIFLKNDAFTVFIVSDVLALLSSATSMLMFLSILTSRYAEEDFLWSLPNKLIIGLVSLFFSIATMMVAFSSTLSIVMRERWAWVHIPVALLGGIPVTLFLLLNFPLSVQIIRSTYGSGVFNPDTRFKLN